MARFKAAFDGGSRGNPGIAAWGVAVLDASGACVEGHAGYLGHATNNVAEYRGLLAALELATTRGASEVEILSDSELIVKQLRGQYKVRAANLKPLFLAAMKHIRGFDSFRITHVRREFNQEADRLVNLALDQAEMDPADTTIAIHEVAPSCGS